MFVDQIKEVKRYIDKNDLFKEVRSVCIALSGGADSVALLYVMKNICEERDINISAVHVNHGIRGESADRDERHAKNICEKFGVEFVSFGPSDFNMTVPKHASEEWARDLRYKAFETVIGNDEYKVIATGHTLTDQAETVLYRAASGVGLKNLSGIRKKRLGYIRPFLSLQREDVEIICKKYKLEYVTDETNLTNDYMRNVIRHNVIPEIKKVHDLTIEHLGEVAEISQECDRLLSDMAHDIVMAGIRPRKYKCVKGVLEIDKKDVQRYNILLKYVIIAWVEILGVSLDKKMLELMVEAFKSVDGVKTTLCISDSIQVVIDSKNSTFTAYDRKTKDEAMDSTKINIEVPYHYEDEFCNEFTIAILDEDEKFNINTISKDSDVVYYVDADKVGNIDVATISSPFVDSVDFRLANGKNRKIKKTMAENGIEAWRRNKVAGLKINGEYVWVKEVGTAKKYSVDKNTKKFIQIIVL